MSKVEESLKLLCAEPRCIACGRREDLTDSYGALARLGEDGAPVCFTCIPASEETVVLPDTTRGGVVARVLRYADLGVDEEGEWLDDLFARIAALPYEPLSAEPVEWQLCARKQGSAPWGPTRPRSWMRYDSAAERDRVAANLAREHIVEVRDLYATAPHPEGER